MGRPVTAPAPAPHSAPELVAEIQRMRQNIAMMMAHHDVEASRCRRIEAGLQDTLRQLGYGVPDDPRLAGDVRLAQGLDDVRGELESTVTRLAELQHQVAALATGHRLLSAEVRKLVGKVEQRCLESDQYSVQALEQLREVAANQHTLAAAATIAMAATPPKPRAVEVSGGRRRRLQLVDPAVEERTA